MLGTILLSYACLHSFMPFYLFADLSRMTMLVPDIYLYLIIFFCIIFFIAIFIFYFLYRRKKQVFEQIYRKLSDSDKQVFHVIRATEKRSLPTIQNIVSVFFNINGNKIGTDQLLQRLYRLENLGLVNISITTREGKDVQICNSLHADRSVADLISNRYKLFLGIFLPLSIISLSVCYYLLQFVDLVVHGDLYGYGLVFSYEWANQYWNITALIRSSLNVVLFILGISLILTITNFRVFKKILKITSCVLFIVGTAFVSYSIFLLSQLDFIVNHDLYTFGLTFSYQWADKYWFYLGLLYILFLLSLVFLLICFIFCIFSKAVKKSN